MNHELRATLFQGESMLYCTCRNFFRIVSNDATVKDIEQMFSVHKWAWQEEESRSLSLLGVERLNPPFRENSSPPDPATVEGDRVLNRTIGHGCVRR